MDEPMNARLYAAARTLGQSLDLEQLWWLVAREAAQLVPGAQSLLFEHRSRGALVAVAAHGHDTRALVSSRIGLRATGLGQEDLRGLDVVDTDVLATGNDALFLRPLLAMGPALALPLVGPSELIGLLLLVLVGRTERPSFSELALSRDLAGLAGDALHNARLYRNAQHGQGRLEGMMERMSQLRERERRVFAAILHDDILQPLVGGVYALEALRDRVMEEGLPDFDHVLRMLRLGVTDARSIIWEVRPGVLDGLGLSEALGAIADRIAVEGHATVETSLRDIDGVGEAVSTAVYKIGREALLNADRHAEATYISLVLGMGEDRDTPLVELVVRDDGCGFDAQTAHQRGHYGLALMEEQAVAVGGTLSITSGRGVGTTVRLRVPVVRTARARENA